MSPAIPLFDFRGDQTKISWAKVAQEASALLGRKHSGAYCREVAYGLRTSSRLEPILQDLGLMSSSVATPAHAVAA